MSRGAGMLEAWDMLFCVSVSVELLGSLILS